MILHDQDWLIGGTLGASMIFSSKTTIHAIALAAVRDKGTVDLDIIPVFAITGVGMLAGTPMLIWSETLRKAAPSARAVVNSWILIMFAGSVASIISLRAVPKLQACDGASLLDGSCGLACNTTLPMRNGQSIISIPYPWKDYLFNYSGLFAAFGPIVTIMSLTYAYSLKDPGTRESGGTSIYGQRQAMNEGKLYYCALLIPPLGLALALAQIIVLELIMMGPHHVPLGEGLDAIGQWGTIVEAFFAIVAAVMKTQIDKRTRPHDASLHRQRTGDFEMGDMQTHHPGLQPN